MQNTSFGLTENEAHVYQALLELGPARVSAISKKAALNRTTSYDILERLMLYGLVAPASGEGSRKQYVAEHPTRLVQHLERQQRTAERTLAKVKEQLPELALLYKTIKKPSIKFFEGEEGMKQIYADTLQSKTEIICLIDMEEGWDEPRLLAFAKKYIHERARRKIHERAIALDTPATVDWLTNYPAPKTYTHYKFINHKLYKKLHLEINVYDDKTMIALLKKTNRMGILIQNQELADALRILFELAWNALPETKKNKS